ncbi:hypothetical protein PVAG01_01234 [Phlyctema vagabunda]|uniref:AB hydrolase-1 domain-containing protein n=1 Tax=Phlyctema vagabunda TaxID=108571 RepID=A0ABR4PWI2_9HELO
MGTFIPPVSRGDDFIAPSSHPPKKPAIVIVQGIMQTKIHYNYFVSLLNLEGYDVYYPDLPSNTRQKETTNMYDDAAVIKQFLEVLIMRQHRQVIVIMHCYGGVVGTQAVTQNLVKKWRERYKLEGGVVHLMYIAAFMLPLGDSVATVVLRDKVCGERWDWEETFHMLPDQKLVMKDAGRLFYNDTVFSTRKPSFWATFVQNMYHTHLLDPLTNAQYFELRCTYVCCKLDRFLSEDGQCTMVEKMLEANVEIDMDTVNSGHVPFLRAPSDIVEIVNKLDLTPPEPIETRRNHYIGGRQEVNRRMLQSG